jgi:hypothetical protein
MADNGSNAVELAYIVAGTGPTAIKFTDITAREFDVQVVHDNPETRSTVLISGYSWTQEYRWVAHKISSSAGKFPYINTKFKVEKSFESENSEGVTWASIKVADDSPFEGQVVDGWERRDLSIVRNELSITVVVRAVGNYSGSGFTLVFRTPDGVFKSVHYTVVRGDVSRFDSDPITFVTENGYVVRSAYAGERLRAIVRVVLSDGSVIVAGDDEVTLVITGMTQQIVKSCDFTAGSSGKYTVKAVVNVVSSVVGVSYQGNTKVIESDGLELEVRDRSAYKSVAIKLHRGFGFPDVTRKLVKNGSVDLVPFEYRYSCGDSHLSVFAEDAAEVFESYGGDPVYVRPAVSGDITYGSVLDFTFVEGTNPDFGYAGGRPADTFSGSDLYSAVDRCIDLALYRSNATKIDFPMFLVFRVGNHSTTNRLSIPSFKPKNLNLFPRFNVVSTDTDSELVVDGIDLNGGVLREGSVVAGDGVRSALVRKCTVTSSKSTGVTFECCTFEPGSGAVDCYIRGCKYSGDASSRAFFKDCKIVNTEIAGSNDDPFESCSVYQSYIHNCFFEKTNSGGLFESCVFERCFGKYVYLEKAEKFTDSNGSIREFFNWYTLLGIDNPSVSGDHYDCEFVACSIPYVIPDEYYNDLKNVYRISRYNKRLRDKDLVGVEVYSKDPGQAELEKYRSVLTPSVLWCLNCLTRGAVDSSTPLAVAYSWFKSYASVARGLKVQYSYGKQDKYETYSPEKAYWSNVGSDDESLLAALVRWSGVDGGVGVRKSADEWRAQQEEDERKRKEELERLREESIERYKKAREEEFDRQKAAGEEAAKAIDACMNTGRGAGIKSSYGEQIALKWCTKGGQNDPNYFTTNHNHSKTQYVSATCQTCWQGSDRIICIGWDASPRLKDYGHEAPQCTSMCLSGDSVDGKKYARGSVRYCGVFYA